MTDDLPQVELLFTEAFKLRLRALAIRREESLTIAAQDGAYNVRVFSSVARGEVDSTNDVDFLVAHLIPFVSVR